MSTCTDSGKAKNLLMGLGRPTKRGVRKCPRCGTVNGTRGLSCKGRNCDMIFKEAAGRRKSHLEACRLITDSASTFLFSVKLRERGSEQRGFVKFHLCQPSSSMLPVELSTSKGECHVQGCPASFSSSNGPQTCCDISCVHVAACLQISAEPKEAQPLPVKHSVLNAMSISADWKHKIWLRARKDGPLAQRASLTTMVVKCEPDDWHPLGYLHTVFICGDENNICKFGCACDTLRNAAVPSRKSILVLPPRFSPSNSPEANRCIHFYSCLAVFLSDSTLSKEFSTFISDDQLATGINQVITVLDIGGGDDDDVVGSQLDEFEARELIEFDVPLQIEMETSDGDIQTISLPVISGSLTDEAVVKALSELTNTQLQGANQTAFSPTKRQRTELFASQAAPVEGPAGGVVQMPDEIQLWKPEDLTGHPIGEENPIVKELALEDIREDVPLVGPAAVTFSAIEWIASITERINQSMHYGFPGKPAKVLALQAPQRFFDVLRDRMSLSGLPSRKENQSATPKQRLPNSTRVVRRKNKLPLGTFTTDTWKLVNVLQVKIIFDTPLVELEVSRKFRLNQSGSYEYIPANEPKAGSSLLLASAKSESSVFKTYLKVGQMSGEKDVTPFVVEWTPNVLRKTEIGELVIKFEYGHQVNGQHALPPKPF